MEYALYHDIDETVSGDIPGPYKRVAVNKQHGKDAARLVLSDRFGEAAVGIVDSVDPEIKDIVSVADTIDELCYLIEEARSGNTWIKTVITEVRARLKRRWMTLPAVERVLKSTWLDVEELTWDSQFADPALLKDPT